MELKTEAENYRPISLLLIEKPSHDQIQDYLQRNGLLYIY